MAIVYKIDILPALKAAGYNTGRIRREKLMGEATLQKIRDGERVSYNHLNIICRLLQCQPGDLIEWIEDK